LEIGEERTEKGRNNEREKRSASYATKGESIFCQKEKGESIWIRCGDDLLDQIGLFNLTVKLSVTPVRDLIEPSP
jgi:hypothetical protein